MWDLDCDSLKSGAPGSAPPRALTWGSFFGSARPDSRKVYPAKEPGVQPGGASTGYINLGTALEAVASTAAGTATAAAASKASAVSASAAATAAAAPGTIFFRTRLIHRQVTAAHAHSVQGFHSLGCRIVVSHLDEGKSSRLSGVTVCHDTHPVNLSV